MPKVNRIAKCRKSLGKCGKCGAVIEAGQPYLHWAFMVGGRGGPKIVRCARPECAPRPADLTQSDYLRAVYGLQEETFAHAKTTEDLESARDDARGQVEELQQEQQDKLDNMPEGLQQGDTGQLIQERIEACESCASELDGVDISFDAPEGKTEAEAAEALKERLAELRDELSSALGNLQ